MENKLLAVHTCHEADIKLLTLCAIHQQELASWAQAHVFQPQAK